MFTKITVYSVSVICSNKSNARGIVSYSISYAPDLSQVIPQVLDRT